MVMIVLKLIENYCDTEGVEPNLGRKQPQSTSYHPTTAAARTKQY